MESIGFLGALIAMAFLVESTVEFVFRWLAKDIIGYVALAVGVLVAILFGIDAIKEFLGWEAQVPYVGQVATGLIIGRGGNFVHDFHANYIKAKVAS